MWVLNQSPEETFANASNFHTVFGWQTHATCFYIISYFWAGSQLAVGGAQGMQEESGETPLVY